MSTALETPDKFIAWVNSLDYYTFVGYANTPTQCPIGKFLKEIEGYDTIPYVHLYTRYTPGSMTPIRNEVWVSNFIHSLDKRYEATTSYRFGNHYLYAGELKKFVAIYFGEK